VGLLLILYQALGVFNPLFPCLNPSWFVPGWWIHRG
jgi:hypothetical protein